jgi:Zn-dependent metalloprotease
VQNFQPVVNAQIINFNGHDIEIVQSYNSSNCKCTIIPPHLAASLNQVRLQKDREDLRELNKKHNIAVKKFRETRQDPCLLFHNCHLEEHRQNLSKSKVPVLIRAYDAHHTEELPGTLVSSNVKPQKTKDRAVKQAMDHSLTVFEFYLSCYNRNSIDGHNMPIDSTLHYGVNFENAFWNGERMVYGDGSEYFGPFSDYLDIIAHELTHGTTVLDYKDESGALNESLSDVFGVLARQFKYKLTVSQDSWLIGYSLEIGGIILDGNKHYPIRSMSAPGTAYDTPILGKDPQPANYQDRYLGKEDDGGVHINSGIPNHAFYLAAMKIGGVAWEKVGLVWYITSHTVRLLKPNATMAEFAKATLIVAKKTFAQEPVVYEAILEGWKKVGVIN